MKEVVMIKTKTAVIILSAIVLILGFAVFYYLDKNYQKETETFPRISVYYKDKEIGKAAVTEANWLYKGHGEIVEKEKTNLSDYNFPEDSIVLVGNNNPDYVLKADSRHKTNFHYYDLRKVNGAGQSNGNGDGDISKALQSGMAFAYTNGTGEYIYNCRFTYKQGYAEHALKIISFDQVQAEIAKDYLNTSLTDTGRIEDLLKNTKYGPMFNSCKVDGTNLIIEYKFHIRDDIISNVKMHNLILFACIPELETITYSPENKKTFYFDDEEEANVVNEEVEKRVYTREQVDGENLMNIENLKKFMDQI